MAPSLTAFTAFSKESIDRIVTSVNASFLRLVGCDSEEEFVGKPFTETKTNRVQDIPRYQEMISSLMKGKPSSSSEFLYVRGDGKSRGAEVHPGLLMKDCKALGIQVIMRYVTDRKNAEMMTQESQQKLEQLFMSSPEATVFMNPDFHILDVNPCFMQLFEYSLDEIKGKSINDVLVPKDKVAEDRSVVPSEKDDGSLQLDYTRNRRATQGSPIRNNHSRS